MLKRLTCKLFGHELQYTGRPHYTFVCLRCGYNMVNAYKGKER